VSGAGSLEERYRRLLRAYPASWRARREEEVLAVLLDDAQAHGRSRPTAREVLDLAGAGLAARVDPVLGLVGERTRRRIATLATVSGVALSVPALLQAELPSRVTRLPSVAVPWLPTSGWWPSPALAVYLGWLVGAAVILAGRPSAGRTWLAASTALAAVTPWLDAPVRAWLSPGSLTSRAAQPFFGPPPRYFLGVLVCLGVLACSATARTDAPTRWRTALGTGLLTAVVFFAPWTNGPDASFWTRFSGPPFVFYRSGGYGLSAIALEVPWLLAAAVVTALLVGLRRPGWIAPVLVVCIPWTYLAAFGGLGSSARVGFPFALLLTGVVGTLIAAAAVARSAGVRVVRVPRT